jgi:hypothetical protein
MALALGENWPDWWYITGILLIGPGTIIAAVLWSIWRQRHSDDRH